MIQIPEQHSTDSSNSLKKLCVTDPNQSTTPKRVVGEVIPKFRKYPVGIVVTLEMLLTKPIVVEAVCIQSPSSTPEKPTMPLTLTQQNKKKTESLPPNHQSHKAIQLGYFTRQHYSLNHPAPGYCELYTPDGGTLHISTEAEAARLVSILNNLIFAVAHLKGISVSSEEMLNIIKTD